MIVCHCNQVTDREIREAVQEGARSVRQVGRACSAGQCCGGCKPAIREIVQCERRAESPGLLTLVPATGG